MSSNDPSLGNRQDILSRDVPTCCLPFITTLVVFVLYATAWSSQSPILLTFDLHVDPVSNGFSEEGKAAAFQERTEWMEWVLDQTEPHSIPISFLSGGWYMERVAFEEASGDGALLVRRMYENGGQIGSHHHNDFRSGPFNWPSMESGASLQMVRKQWKNNIDWVNAGIEKALAIDPPVLADNSDINRIKGAHSPQNESDYHQLMSEFGLDVREPGPEEDYYGYFDHHIWHPYRPSEANYLGEDLNAPFVQVPSGPVIGYKTVHHGTLQDMRPASMKRQILQIYLNWRYANRISADPKVWTWGWGSHAKDFEPASESRLALLEILPWIETHFRSRIEPDGSSVLQYATHLEVADAYLNWETENSGVSSFSFDSLVVEDWTTYPWLQAVAEEMYGYLWESDLAISDVTAFQLDRDGSDAVLLYSDEMVTVNVDLEFIFPSRVQIVGLESGDTLSGTTGGLAREILVADEPLWITAAPEPVALLLGDANNDLLVSGSDLIAVQQHFGDVESSPLTGNLLGDANDDGMVTGLDLTTVQQNFGSVLDPADDSIPEPGVLTVLVLGSLYLMRRRVGI